MPSETVLVTTRSFASGDEDPTELLRRAGCEVRRAGPDHDAPDVLGVLPQATGDRKAHV